MDKRGLIYKYKLNRPLTQEDIYRHLPVNKPSGAKPWYQLTVIRMNSTYLECIDKYFLDKGLATSGMIFIILLSIWVIVAFIEITLSRCCKLDDILMTLLFCLMFSPLAAIAVYGLKKEAFQYTHYPIRFNRKTRMVYACKTDGTIIDKSWDDIYFTLVCLGTLGGGQWEPQGLILEPSPGSPPLKNADGTWNNEALKTAIVRDLFPLSTHDTFSSRHLLEQWEFIRRYMEEPDELPKLANQIAHVHDIADRREGYGHGFQNLITSTGGLLAYAILPVVFIYSLGRVLAMHTGKIPQWPEEIEAQCRIEPYDPYVRDGNNLVHPDDVKMPRGSFSRQQRKK